MECDLCHREVDTEVEGHSRGQACDHELCRECFLGHLVELRLAIHRKALDLPGCPVCGVHGPPGELQERWLEQEAQWMEALPESEPDPKRPRLWPAFVGLAVLAAALILFGRL